MGDLFAAAVVRAPGGYHPLWVQAVGAVFCVLLVVVLPWFLWESWLGRRLGIRSRKPGENE